MKRRGYKPNLRTYHTLLSGYAKDSSVAVRPSSLARAQKVYDQYKTYCLSLPRNSAELSPKPANDYLTTLNNAGQIQAMYDVFWEMPATGKLAPDLVTFTILINAVRNRRVLHDGPGLAPAGAEEDVARRNADDINFLWMRLVAASERAGFKIDGYAAAPTIFALAKGSPQAREDAFAIVHDYLGLSPDPETAPKPRLIDLSSQLFKGVLELCLATRNHERCIHYVRSLIQRPHTMESVALNNGHMIYLLESLASLSADDPSYGKEALGVIEWMLTEERKGGWRMGLRPDIRAYLRAFLACRRAKDWDSAAKLFELMSGYRVVDFAVPLVPLAARGMDPPANFNVPKRFEILPDVAIMNLMTRTALLAASRGSDDPVTPTEVEAKAKAPEIHDSSPIYLCLRIISHLTPGRFLFPIPNSHVALATESAPTHRERRANQRRFAQTVVETLEALEKYIRHPSTSMTSGTMKVKPPTGLELVQWGEIKTTARRTVKHLIQIPKRELESQRAGGDASRSNSTQRFRQGARIVR